MFCFLGGPILSVWVWMGCAELRSLQGHRCYADSHSSYPSCCSTSWVSSSAWPLESCSSSSCRWWDAASAAAAAAGTAGAACTRSRAGGWAAGAGRSGPLSWCSPLSSCECAGREAPDGTQGWLEIPALCGRGRKLPLFTSRSRHGGTKERKQQRWEAGPGGLRIGTVQTLPDSFPTVYRAPPCLSFLRPSSSPSVQGTCWDALEAGVTGVFQTLQAGVCVGAFGGYWGGALGLSSPHAYPATLPLQSWWCLCPHQQRPLLPGCEEHLPQCEQHSGRHPHLRGLHPPGTHGPPATSWGKGPGGRSSPNSPLGKGNRRAGSRERSPPSLMPHLCPYSKWILSSTRAMSH